MLRLVTSRMICLSTLLILSCAFLGCGGNKSSIPQQPTPNIAGAWEFIAVSNTGAVTGIEVALTEGSVLVNGVAQPNGQISANSSQIAYVSLQSAGPDIWNVSSFGGACEPGTTDNGLSGSITAIDAPIQFTFTENGNVFSVTGTLSGDGKSLLLGTYAPLTGNACTSDTGGTITGASVAKISGNYAGQICALNDTSSPCSPADSATAAVSENSSSNLTLNLNLTGTDNTSLTLSGPVTGNAFVARGTVQGQPVTYYGYYEPVNNIPSLYMVNATNTASPNYVGTLAVPQP